MDRASGRHRSDQPMFTTALRVDIEHTGSPDSAEAASLTTSIISSPASEFPSSPGDLEIVEVRRKSQDSEASVRVKSLVQKAYSVVADIQYCCTAHWSCCIDTLVCGSLCC